MENLLNWTRDSQNRLMFTERIEKYALFKNPQVRRTLSGVDASRGVRVFMSLTNCLSLTCALTQNYLLGRKETSEMNERNKEALLEVSWILTQRRSV